MRLHGFGRVAERVWMVEDTNPSINRLFGNGQSINITGRVLLHQRIAQPEDDQPHTLKVGGPGTCAMDPDILEQGMRLRCQPFQENIACRHFAAATRAMRNEENLAVAGGVHTHLDLES